MSTLADIAKICNTSTATVSYVLNGQGEQRRISDEKQKLVLSAAEQLGYSKRVPKHKDSHRIGIFWPDRNLETTLTSVISGINSALLFETIPLSINIYPYGHNRLSEKASLWSASALDSAVIISPNFGDINYLSQRRPKVPTVLINRKIDGYSSVSTDYDAVGKLAAEHAINKGGNDIALVLNSTPYFGMNQRSKKIYEVCKSHGVDLKDKIFYSRINIVDGYTLGIRIIRDSPPPRVIVCVYDTVAYGIMRALNESNIKVGKEIEILATSTSLPGFFEKSTPSMTVVDLKMAESSQRAIRLAIDHATQVVKAPTQITIMPEIIFRESSPMPQNPAI